MSARAMGKGRLEAFTDGVVAIIIMVREMMVREMKVPHGADFAALRKAHRCFLHMC